MPDKTLEEIFEIQNETKRLEELCREIRQDFSERCKFGSGKHLTSTCPMLYIHISGYYLPEFYQEVLMRVCPNIKGMSPK
jgi:hypothetical protein